MPQARIKKRQKPANRNWGKPMPLADMHGPQNVCQFEKMIKKLELTPEQYEQSLVLRAWVKKNHNRFYVPEHLLMSWNMNSLED